MMLFPVNSPPPGCAKYVRWEHLGDPMAERNHGQSLKRLAERGGLTPVEILANVRQISVQEAMKVLDSECIWVVNSIGAEWPEKPAKPGLVERFLGLFASRQEGR